MGFNPSIVGLRSPAKYLVIPSREQTEVNMASSSTKIIILPGTSFTGLLTIVFITLKLLGIINWSWIWVLSPLWIPVALGIVVLLFFLGLAVVFLAVCVVAAFMDTYCK